MSVYVCVALVGGSNVIGKHSAYANQPCASEHRGRANTIGLNEISKHDEEHGTRCEIAYTECIACIIKSQRTSHPLQIEK